MKNIYKLRSPKNIFFYNVYYLFCQKHIYYLYLINKVVITKTTIKAINFLSNGLLQFLTKPLFYWFSILDHVYLQFLTWTCHRNSHQSLFQKQMKDILSCFQHVYKVMIQV